MKSYILVMIILSLILVGCKPAKTSDIGVTEDTKIEMPSNELFNVRIIDRKVDPEVIEVDKGSVVTLEVVSDKNMLFKIEGLGLDQRIVANKAIEFMFVASKQGIFPITNSKEHLDGYIVVV